MTNNQLLKKISTRINKLEQQLQTRFFIDLNFGYKNSVVLLAGVSRSGTTWLSNIINYDNNYRYIFEPFKHNKVEIFKDYNPKLYISPSTEEKEFLKKVRLVMSGKLRNEWADRFNQKIISSQRLIKVIHANLFLKWLHLNFPEIPIIFLLRHPYAVATSKIKLKFEMSLSCYLVQEKLMEDFLNPFRQELEQAEENYQKTGNAFENYIFNWCIENYVPLKQFKQDEIHVIFYEELCARPEYIIEKMFKFLNKDYNDKSMTAFYKPSQLSRKNSAVKVTNKNLVDAWKKDITEAQVTRTVEILKLFELDKIYTQDPMPHSENLSQIMG